MLLPPCRRLDDSTQKLQPRLLKLPQRLFPRKKPPHKRFLRCCYVQETIQTCRFKAKKLQIGEFINNTDTVKHWMSDIVCVCVCVCASCVSSRAKVASSCHSSSAWEFKSSSLQPQHIWGEEKQRSELSAHITFPFSSAAPTLPPLQMASSGAPQRHQWKQNRKKKKGPIKKKKKIRFQTKDSGTSRHGWFGGPMHYTDILATNQVGGRVPTSIKGWSVVFYTNPLIS